MSERIKIAVIGTGAVGGYYGGLLQRSGQEVHFLLHSDFEHVREHGLRVDSKNGDFVLPQVNAYSDPKQMPACELVILSLKTTANRLLPEFLPHVAGKDGIVLVLQNGLGPDEEVAAIVGPGRVIGGLCFLCSNKFGPGHIHHLDYGLITLGEYQCGAGTSPAKDGQTRASAPHKTPNIYLKDFETGITPRLEKLGRILEGAGIPIRLEEDLLSARWKKLVWNIPFNGLSVVHNCLTDVLVGDPEIRALCRTLMEEIAAAAAVCARPIAPEFIDKMITDTEKMEPYAPSMKLDFDNGRTMEVEAIYGNPLRAAQAAGVPMPETERLYAQLLASSVL